jgi:hypothetical protein
MVMALFGKSKKKTIIPVVPNNVFWIRSPKNKFYNFLNLEPEEVGLKRVSGVYVIWHGGLRPEWIYIGQTDDLAQAFENLRGNDEVMEFQGHGSLFVTWSEIRQEFQAGVVQYLNNILKPIVANPKPPDKDETPIAVYPPGLEPPTLTT